MKVALVVAVLSVAVALYLVKVRKSEDPCPQLSHCLSLEPGKSNSVVYITCLRRIVADTLWNPTRIAWNPCAAEAGLALMRKMLWAVKTVDGPRPHHEKDLGAPYIAVILGEAFAHCISVSGSESKCPGMSWVEVESVMRYSPEIGAAFERYQQGVFPQYDTFKFRAMEVIFRLPEEKVRADVITFGPYGFHNEPFFAPSLTLPLKNLKVTALMMQREMFDSSMLRHAVFPWSLQSDADLGGLFLRDSIARMQAKWVFPGDSIAVLMIAKAATRMFEALGLTEVESQVLQVFARSSPWPPQYPAPTLSKLIPGHEPFAPEERVVTDDDGLRNILPDFARIAKAWEEMGGANASVYLKKEYSEAGRAVAKPTDTGDSLKVALQKIYSRGDGIGYVDLDINIRIFLQKEIRLKPHVRPTGFRLFAQAGKIMAGHLSVVDTGTELYGVAYSTIRHPVVESATAEFLQAINFTGFGAVWWWIGLDDRPYLIDFNPRMERHACINGALQAAGSPEIQSDPCTVFQRIAGGEVIDEAKLPLIVKEGFKYMEPMRVVNLGPTILAQAFVDLLKGTYVKYHWNIQPLDDALYSLHKMNVDQFLIDYEEKVVKPQRLKAEAQAAAHAAEQKPGDK
jgi:hypothetical protein